MNLLLFLHLSKPYRFGSLSFTARSSSNCKCNVCFDDSGVSMKTTVAMKASEMGSEDNGLNWLVFELLWRDFFRCSFIVGLYIKSSPQRNCLSGFHALLLFVSNIFCSNKSQIAVIRP